MKNIASLIDHTLLKPDATLEEIERLCSEAKKYGFATVCINPFYVSFSSECLKGSDIGITTVVGFPLGANKAETKVFETREAIRDGATEIDMVINIGALKSGKVDVVKRDILGVVEASSGRVVKVIIETSLLTDDEKVLACKLALECKADFVKTSTGFSTGGATASDVRLMRDTVRDDLGVKASGGIRTLCDLEKMIDAGASRVGLSASVKIMEEFKEKSKS